MTHLKAKMPVHEPACSPAQRLQSVVAAAGPADFQTRLVRRKRIIERTQRKNGAAQLEPLERVIPFAFELGRLPDSVDSHPAPSKLRTWLATPTKA